MNDTYNDACSYKDNVLVYLSMCCHKHVWVWVGACGGVIGVWFVYPQTPSRHTGTLTHHDVYIFSTINRKPILYCISYSLNRCSRSRTS